MAADVPPPGRKGIAAVQEHEKAVAGDAGPAVACRVGAEEEFDVPVAEPTDVVAPEILEHPAAVPERLGVDLAVEVDDVVPEVAEGPRLPGAHDVARRILDGG